MLFAAGGVENETPFQELYRVLFCVTSIWSKTVGAAFLRWERCRAVPTGDSEEGENRDA
jgi:hypothetical protein